MNEIKFNVPLYFSKSTQNIIKFLKSKKPIHGPGENIIKIKKLLKKYFNFDNVYLTNSCTSALEISALSLDLKKNDEILIPSFAFITTGSSFARTGCQLKYYDIQRKTLMPDFADIKNKVNKNTKAIVVLHYQGYSIDYLDELQTFCKKRKIFLIEDAAQALGSYFKNKPLGSFGDLSCFSFHETKNIHSGSGGMLVVNNKKLINKINSIFDKGTNRFLMMNGKIKYYSWVEIGSAFLMTELVASYLLPQIKFFKKFNLSRKIIYKKYLENLRHLNNKEIYLTNNYKYKYNFHAFVIILKENIRDIFLKYLKKNKINAVISYTPLHQSKMGKKFYKRNDNLINTDKYVNKIVRLPMHSYLNERQINYITNKINNFFKK